ncbi:MAG: hypothetical protein WDO14_24260 [Bacteroidota bacterium]
MRIVWVILSLSSLLASGCGGKRDQRFGKDLESAVLTTHGFARTTMHDSLFTAVMNELNCIAKRNGKRFVFAKDFERGNDSLIMIVPIRSPFSNIKSSAFSNIRSRYILINPDYLIDFAQRSLLSDSTDWNRVTCLILLHELGHFKLKKMGAFDSLSSAPASMLGQQLLDTEPEYLTANKKIELSVDSTAVSMIKDLPGFNNMDCFNVAADLQRILPGMQFQLFGHFAQLTLGGVRMLRDPSPSHPNMELRITFMNYYLFDNPQSRQLIDDYLYEREVAPIHRQETAPYINQDKVKNIP